MSRGSTYGISRVDNETSRTHGWLVTIQRRGVIYRKHFRAPRITRCFQQTSPHNDDPGRIRLNIRS